MSKKRYRASPETRRKIAAGVKAARAKGFGRRRRGWRPPPDEFAALYEELCSKVGMGRARHLIEDHAAVVARRNAVK